MSYSRAIAEKALVQRLGPAIVACDLSASPTTDASPRAYLGDPIGTALFVLGKTDVTDPSNPTDPEVDKVPKSRWRAFLDVAEWRLLETMAGSNTYTTYGKGAGDSQSLSDLRKDWLAMADRKLAQIRAMHPGLKIDGGA